MLEALRELRFVKKIRIVFPELSRIDFELIYRFDRATTGFQTRPDLFQGIERWESRDIYSSFVGLAIESHQLITRLVRHTEYASAEEFVLFVGQHRAVGTLICHRDHTITLHFPWRL